VFCTALGGELLAGNVRRTFRRLTGKAGIGDDWTPSTAAALRDLIISAFWAA